MISEERKYHFVGELLLNRSHVLPAESYPKDDKVNWLFLKVSDKLLSFVYKIETASAAEYAKPFRVYLSFNMDDVAKDLLNINTNYEVLRGEESIGYVKLLSSN
ncbi:MAG: hypothetical protein JWN83_238 [Chitinophagaceae bacterium]|nr:hypothetical protein [Chitinophagaceae bacterium]